MIQREKNVGNRTGDQSTVSDSESRTVALGCRRATAVVVADPARKAELDQ
jgi:hypothetical protein